MGARKSRWLALEPFYGGSHRAFLDGWAAGSRHRLEILSLPATHWKWRMRHAAPTFAGQIAERWAAGERWHGIWCSDMLDLATLRGLLPAPLAALPAVVYFHENQLTYPVREERERDLHFAFTNLTSALAATEVWFNSEYHRDEWLEALGPWLRRMPDHRPEAAAEEIRRRARVVPPGIAPPSKRSGVRRPGPLHILWAARWEHDKGPETFFRALEILADSGTGFQLSVLGERFPQEPEVFERARKAFGEKILHWGFLASREEYLDVLATADVAVSTARHEFFGIAVVEAIAAGCFPLLPRRLAYPEILAPLPAAVRGQFFYDGSADALARQLVELARDVERGDLWSADPDLCRRAMGRFHWSRIRPLLDAGIERLSVDREASKKEIGYPLGDGRE